MKNYIPEFIYTNFKKKILKEDLKSFAMFIDITGFTAITEKLMKDKKEGAEILSDILNKTFNPIIDKIYKNGGFVTTFAGDAFTALFPINEKININNFLESAVYIKNFFRNRNKVSTKLGNFKIGVKIGLSKGLINWGIVGENNKYSYYFKGNAINKCTEAEKNAKNGEIVFYKNLLKDIKRYKINDKGNDFYILNEKTIKNVKQLKIKSVKINKDILKLFIQEEVLKLQVKAEFRDIVSVFISFKNINKFDIFNNFISTVITKSELFNAYFNKLDFGDKGPVILLLFGAPLTYGNNIERALDFILDLKNSTNVKFKAGITYGKVYAGIIGGERRCEYTAISNSVNLSSRLMVSAKFGEFLFDEYIKKNINPNYVFENLGIKEFKGYKAKKKVYKLIGKKEGKRRIFEGEMIGREKELKVLKKALDPLKKNKFSGIVYIDGIAGIGKSRLVNELKKEIEDKNFRWLYLPCEEILKKSLNPFIYFLKNYFDQSTENTKSENRKNFNLNFNGLVRHIKNTEILNELIRTKSFLEVSVGIFRKNSLFESLDAKGRYENTLYAIKNIIKAESLINPVIIEIDDGQWIDNDSKKLLEILTRNVDDFPFLIISSCRFNSDGTEFYFDLNEVEKKIRIKISNFEKKLAKKFIELFFENKLNIKKTLPEKTFSKIWKSSEGNPFYIEQILLYLIENNQIDDKLNIKQQYLKIPSSINEIIIARIDKLTSELKEIVRTASILGREFGVKILSSMLLKMTGEISTKNIKDNTKKKYIRNKLKEGEKELIWDAISKVKYIFKHALLRESIYEMQMKKHLKAIHKLAAETIQEIYKDNINEYLGDIAYHYDQAEIEDKAIDYLEKAGDYAKDNYKNLEAIVYYDSLIEKLKKKIKKFK